VGPRIDEVVRHFEELEDPRCEVNLRHPLLSVIVIALLAVLAGGIRSAQPSLPGVVVWPPDRI